MRAASVLTLSLLVPGVLALIACGGQGERLAIDPATVTVLRSTTPIAANIAEPEPVWNPLRQVLAMRTQTGFALAEEGMRPVFLEANDRRTTAGPQWLDAGRLVFGPAANVVPTPGGRLVPSTDGLSVIDLDGSKVEARRDLAKSGYRPRVGHLGVFAQVEDRIIRVQPGREPEDFVRGFFAEPQPDGGGVAWTTVPVFEPDHWTGQPAPGAMVIRWRPGVSDEHPGLVQPRWSAGRIYATRLGAIPAGVQGRHAILDRTPCDIVLLTGPGAAPRTVLANAHSPAPHPTAELFAAIGRDGALLLASSDGRSTRLAEVGRDPAWSHDGRRLAYVIPGTTADEPATVAVLVLTREPR